MELLLEIIDSKFEISFITLWEYVTDENPKFDGSFKNEPKRTFYPNDYAEKITHYSLSKIS